jgi:hypothetical protein
MTHLILSRVNIPRELDPYKYDDPAPYKSDEWNKKRIELLNKFLRPSLMQQTCQDFTFITLWHDYYTEDFRNRLGSEYQIIIERGWDEQDEQPFDFEQWKQGKIVKQTMDFWKQIRDKTKQFAEGKTLVTNVDSDDALHYKFVERLQERAKDVEPYYYLDISKRLAYNPETGATGNKTTSGASPVISTVEPNYECIPLKYHHAFFDDYIEGEKVKGLKVVQTITGNNIFCGGTGTETEIKLEQYF